MNDGGSGKNGGAQAIERLLNPRSIAILGASPERDSIGGGVLGNLETFGYGGEIHLVSRSRTEINGRPCVKSITDLPRGIDVAVLIVPHAAIRESVVACIAQGVGETPRPGSNSGRARRRSPYASAPPAR